MIYHHLYHLHKLSHVIKERISVSYSLKWKMNTPIRQRAIYKLRHSRDMMH